MLHQIMVTHFADRTLHELAACIINSASNDLSVVIFTKNAYLQEFLEHPFQYLECWYCD
jgi:hypothetical protein